MLNVTDISLIEIMKKYLITSPSDFQQDGKSNRYKVVCPFHHDSDPSLVLFDNTSEGLGWDYHCYACKAHGNAVSMLTTKLISTDTEIFKEEESAINAIREDFNLILPDKVRLEDLSKIKGLNLEVLVENGWINVDNGVAIPFYNTNGEEKYTKIRTKYVGKPKYIYSGYDEILPYGLQWLNSYDKTLPIYITEGETDCITMYQAGMQVLGMVSNSGFKPKFIDFIKDFSKVIVVKDNDKEAGKVLVDAVASVVPEKTWVLLLPGKIKDINNYHLYACGSNIEVFKQKFNTIDILPATPEAFMTASLDIQSNEKAWKILNDRLVNPIKRDKFKQDFCAATGIGKRTVDKMLADFEIEKQKINDIIIEDNCCYRQTFIGAVPTLKQITNFIIKPKYIKVVDSIDGEYEEIRVVTIVNKKDDVITIELDAQELSSVGLFEAKLTSSGNNSFCGTLDDLRALRESIFEASVPRIYSPFASGFITIKDRKQQKHKQWIFGNCGIDGKGNIVPYKDESTIELNGNTFKPIKLITNPKSEDSELPLFNLNLQKLSNEELRDLLFKFRDNLGSYNSWIGLGWVAACWFSALTFKNQGIFPYLFVEGKKGQGKTRFCELLIRSFARNPKSEGKGFATATVPAMSRALEYYHSLPKWYDDYKDSQVLSDVDPKGQLLLGAYNGKGREKASPDGEGVITSSVNAPLILSGEYNPTNSALKSRCITISMNKNNRNNALYPEVLRLFERFSINCLDLAKQVVTNDVLFDEKLKYYIQLMETKGITDRPQDNIAVLLAGFDVAFAHVLSAEELNDFVDFAVALTHSNDLVIEQEHHLVRFFEDLAAMMVSDKSEFRYGRDITFNKNNDKIMLKISGTHRLWTEFQPNRKVVANESTVRSNLKAEPYYVGGDESKYRFSSGQTRCYVFSKEKMVETGKFDDFIEILENQSIIETPTTILSQENPKF